MRSHGRCLGRHLSPRGLVAWSLALGGCAAQTAMPRAEADTTALLRADSVFAAANAERGAEAWAESFTGDGVMLLSGTVIEGRAEIRRVMADAYADTSFRLDWSPSKAGGCSGADLGYTIGRYRSRGLRGEEDVVRRGVYLTVWRRGEDGRWRAEADVGSEAR